MCVAPATGHCLLQQMKAILKRLPSRPFCAEVLRCCLLVATQTPGVHLASLDEWSTADQKVHAY